MAECYGLPDEVGENVIDPSGPGAIKAWVADLRHKHAGRPHSAFAYGAHTEQIVEHWPTTCQPALRTLVSIHGGAFMADIDRTSHHPLCQHLQARGYEIYNIEYRRTGTAALPEDTLRDVRAAVRSVVAHCQRDIVVVGHSVGGYLGESVADVTGVSRVVSLAPLTDLWGWALETHPGPLVSWLRLRDGEAERAARRLSLDPSRMVNAERRLIHGSHDAVVPIALSRRYVADVTRAGRDIGFVEMPGEGHFAFIDPAQPAFELVAQQLEP